MGPSGSGKSSIGRQFWPGVGISNLAAGWSADAPIVDAIAPSGNFSALAAVGLGDVPAWLRPFHVLSVGEQFRAGLARLIADPPERVIVDEFTSALDRQIARFGALAFAKSWCRLPGSQHVAHAAEDRVFPPPHTEIDAFCANLASTAPPLRSAVPT